MGEFELIQRYLKPLTQQRNDVPLGIGDDGALLNVPPGKQVVISTDTLVEGMHFFVNTAAQDIGYKALAVNLSDMAAMGALPSWVSLAVTMPSLDENWIEGFCQGFAQLATAHGVQLIGGDTTRGPLTVTVQICGLVDSGQALLRSGAKAGDAILVTGTLGDARLALQAMQGELTVAPQQLAGLKPALLHPIPRVVEALAIAEVGCHAAIDISDGFAADLGHILQASGVGADIRVADLPVSQTSVDVVGARQARQMALAGGDDYELCFTCPVEAVAKIRSRLTTPVSVVGVITQQPGLRLYDEHGKPVYYEQTGYQHF